MIYVLYHKKSRTFYAAVGSVTNGARADATEFRDETSAALAARYLNEYRNVRLEGHYTVKRTRTVRVAAV